MRYSNLVTFISLFNFGVVYSFPDNIFSGEEFDESGMSLTEMPNLFDSTTENVAWNSKSTDSRAFDLGTDLGDSNTDMIWDPELILADATVSDFCASQANPSSLEARDGASCSPLQEEPFQARKLHSFSKIRWDFSTTTFFCSKVKLTRRNLNTQVILPKNKLKKEKA